MGCGCGSAGIPAPSGALDAVRARAISKWGIVSPLTTDDSPLVVDLVQPQQYVGKHWIIEHLSFIGFLAKRATGNGTPVNGLFLCPPNTAPAETLANSVATGIVLAARPFVLPISERGCPSEALPSGNFVVNYTLQPGFKTTVPGGWFIRAIVNCLPGTLTPGPGVGSYGILQHSGMVEP